MQQHSAHSSADLQRRDQQHIWHPFTSLASALPVIPIVEGKGVWLKTAEGRQILDGISSWWVNLHGHAHPHIAGAIAAQAHRLEQVIFAGFTHPAAVALAEQLLPQLPGRQELLFFSDNGSTAVEVALKMALQYWHNRNEPRQTLIALEGAYHGDTFGAMAVGGRGSFNRPFEQHLFDVEFIPFPEAGQEEACLEALRRLVGRGDVAAVIVEPLLQGAGGMRMYPAAVLDELFTIAQTAGVLCIADEVMTGFGRTGSLFACQQLAQRSPDLICLSKGLTGGFMPLGLTACTAAVAQAFRDANPDKTFYHGHSYTANPLACAAALASLELSLSDSCTQQRQAIARSHAAFASEIARHPSVEKVRQCGTILALELVTGESTSYFNARRNQIYQFFLDRDILLRPLGNVVYLMPPLCDLSCRTGAHLQRHPQPRR
ncbi:adenosylmethionine--8-amino-7-oxononanoate transaminase [Cesiribacter andamanensis]|uniref:Adenosylmethionine-8-amino-7-oxononanoate aminotransferase n=1 Tax=Cesiribacter andamanensis AMV16 TaxID=1279009 RepID=M7NCD5_9BACT|nr:adenosylmethionine--8-amino-7-oxononanoate transaminase [Cesiribacter andamanensis]EMR04816.1 Adenosylmethionine-8-amino-7-oxononanoate aminotransferase [Cesiribacter andamanensis AMV16]